MSMRRSWQTPALDRNLDVVILSDNVALEDEIQLKTGAREKGLLVMEPTAVHR